LPELLSTPRGSREGGLDITGPDLAYRRLAIVNVAFRGPPDAGDRGWGR
jgi:hypothetical protein